MNLTFECGCAPTKRLSGPAVVARFRTSRVKRGAPVADVKANHEEIVRDMVRARRHLMVIGIRTLSEFLVKYFTERLEVACDRMDGNLRKVAHIPRTKATFDIEGLGPEEALWREALEEALGPNASVYLIPQFVPIVQSIAAQSHARTTLFLGDPPQPTASVNILRRAQDMGRQITRINETVRERVVRQVMTAVEEGQTVAETVRMIREQIPEIARARVPTIARTEIGNAIDHGTKEAVKNSPSVTYVSVIGCQAVEPNIPTFDGRPTCNIENVPSQRVDELKFHPNHTGAIIPSGFITDR